MGEKFKMARYIVQQHCYTRAKRGLFRQSEGYDTVAHSAGLTESFIKERLHPFCYYHPSRILQAKRVSAAEFPVVRTVVHFPEGLTMLGQTVYVERDFTGQRPAFFTHNLVLPSMPGFFPGMVNWSEFLTGWNGGLPNGELLSELESLPFTDPAPESEGPLPFDNDWLDELVEAVLESVAGTKKIYVTLPGLDWVDPMLMWLYGRLPKEAAQILGFTTYSREPVNKKFLHLVFMDRGSLDGTNIDKIERDYIFDFDNGFFHVPEPLPPEEDIPIKNEPEEGTLAKLLRKFQR